jgi:hypothetical protein
VKYLWFSLFGLVVFLVISCGFGNVPQSSYSFESGMDGWVARGVDLDNPTAEWSAEPSRDHSRDGDSSLRFRINNTNGRAKVWIRRAFNVELNRNYRVNIRYHLASADWAKENPWQIITGVSPLSPTTPDELSFQGDTSNGDTKSSGFEWLEKDYTLNATSATEGLLNIYIGIHGKTQTTRTYYFDSVRISFSRR